MNYQTFNVADQQRKFFDQAEESMTVQLRIRAYELASGGALGRQTAQTLDDAEAIYQWLRKGPAKTDGECG